MAAPVRSRRRARAEADGFVLHTKARFGFAAPAGSSDDPRVRLITQYLPGEVARELFAARDAGGGRKPHQPPVFAPERGQSHGGKRSRRRRWRPPRQQRVAFGVQDQRAVVGLPAVDADGDGRPPRSTTRWIFDPLLPRSVGFGPVSSPLWGLGR